MGRKTREAIALQATAADRQKDAKDNSKTTIFAAENPEGEIL